MTVPTRPFVTCSSAIDANLLALARRFRREPTPAEAAAWELLRGRRLLGLKFRRQQIITGFIVDFYCAELRLVLELDGDVHDDPAQMERDAARTQRLLTRGIRVIRIRNEQLTRDFLVELLTRHTKT